MEKLDIRTHLIVLISATLFWFVFQSNAEIHGLVVLCALYMCVAGYWEKALGFIMTYIIMLLLAYLTAPIMGIMYVVICTFARAIPLTMVAAPILYANPSRMMYSFQRIHVPKNVLVMLCMYACLSFCSRLAYGSFITSYVAHRIFLLYGNGKKL